jgi:site-specific recombinase XerD
MRVSPYSIRVLSLSSWYSVAPKIYIFGSNYAKKAPAFTKNGTAKNGAFPPVLNGFSPQHDVNHDSDSLPVCLINRQFEDWLFDCQFQRHSERTIEYRRDVGKKLNWFLTREGCTHCGTLEVRRFLAHVADGHKERDGRWGNPHMKRPVRPATIHRYFRELRTFFAWLVREEIISRSPMERIDPPKAQSEQIQPFTQEQYEAMLRAARRSQHPRRDEAIIVMLYDTGLRASELCGLRKCDVDIQEKRAVVRGKGDKRRTIYFGKTAAKALWQHLREQPTGENDFIFIADRGHSAGEPLTRTGLMRLIHRLGKAAKIQTVRCSPHTFRHTFAVEFLRNGSNVFTLKEILGHSGLQMTNRYVALAQADLENQHRQFSPADRIKRN